MTKTNKFDLNSVIKILMEDKTIKDGAGTTKVVHAFQGKDDIRTYSRATFKKIDYFLNPRFLNFWPSWGASR